MADVNGFLRRMKIDGEHANERIWKVNVTPQKNGKVPNGRIETVVILH